MITGNGRAFSAGQDLTEIQARITDPDFVPGRARIPGLIDALARFPKAADLRGQRSRAGIGATILGFADLAFMSADARLKCPFTSLGWHPRRRRPTFCPG